jgi:hypothetical protein
LKFLEKFKNLKNICPIEIILQMIEDGLISSTELAIYKIYHEQNLDIWKYYLKDLIK